jgi:hypothetical protein
MWLWNATRLSRIGLIGGLLSFLLATPELLGEDRLRRADDWVRRALTSTFNMYQRLNDRSPWLSILVFGALPGGISAVFLALALGLNPVEPSNSWPRGLLFVIVGAVAGVAATAGVGVMLRAFRDNAAFRKRALFAGALLFLVSWIFQLLATYAPAR